MTSFRNEGVRCSNHRCGTNIFNETKRVSSLLLADPQRTLRKTIGDHFVGVQYHQLGEMQLVICAVVKLSGATSY